VHEVLPCVHDKHCNDKLQCYYQSRGLLLHCSILVTKSLQFQEISLVSCKYRFSQMKFESQLQKPSRTNIGQN
jgi:hypothetical protein